MTIMSLISILIEELLLQMIHLWFILIIYKKQIDIYAVKDFKLVKRINDGKHYPEIIANDIEDITYHYLNVYAGKNIFMLCMSDIRRMIIS